ncbi:2,3-diaminopropionate biosynthesis protein SbnB [Chengkuizengella marina]|uniref:2,3-diaminopropionate biosynthesis protein SbnB n=1 Tax=Chengkuizengella marina TaxID=2507566 RepID=A0A6N9Q901_9BACL|nr:2,3-diaminopropionate biosynthesis protein SbnB [Chengkuizengella marina]NBI31161.1 2,3-diaminopropionate biosynthesis protein SbnB [Chengkuizengella marina]
MIYINENNMKDIGVDWNNIVSVIENATECLANNDFAQPVKPYLRYKDLKNRIIAMPAFVGQNINKSGIKWIASFPDNIKNNKPRAHSVVILNNADTGEPEAIINTALLSIIRTAGVTGSIIKSYSKVRDLKGINIGIIGWGPIGQNHFKMVTELLGDKIANIYLYDLNPIDKNSIDSIYKEKIHISDCWQDAYENSDIFMTCTVSKEPYIDMKPKVGSLQLNISLRDYKTDIFEYVKGNIIVDDWEEVCREKTDIEMMNLEKGLQKKDTKSIVDVLCYNGLNGYSSEEVIMFNPMGMAVFDIAVGSYYVNKAIELNKGQKLD